MRKTVACKSESEAQPARESVCGKTERGEETQMIACWWNEVHSAPSSSPLLIYQGGGGKNKADGGISLGRKQKNQVGNRVAGTSGRCSFWFSKQYPAPSYPPTPHPPLTLSLSHPLTPSATQLQDTYGLACSTCTCKRTHGPAGILNAHLSHAASAHLSTQTEVHGALLLLLPCCFF